MNSFILRKMCWLIVSIVSFCILIGCNNDSPSGVTNLPDIPLLNIPEDETVDQELSVTLAWSVSDGANIYRLQVSSDYKFSKLFIDDTLLIPNKTIEDLSNGQTYYWRVQAIGEGGKGRFSEIWRFTTTKAAPQAPSSQLCFPPDKATAQAQAMTFQWSPSPDAARYHIQVSKSGTFGSLVFQDSTVISAKKMIENLECGTTYYWRVRAGNMGGWSAFTDLWSFTTIMKVPSVPVLLTPPNGEDPVSLTPELIWNETTGAQKYRLQVAGDDSFTTIVFDDSLLTGQSKFIAGLQRSTRYFWRVQANNEGGFSGYSETWSFTTTNETLRKIIPLTLPQISNVEVGSCFITRDVSGSEVAYIIIPVINKKETPLIFFSLRNIRYKDQSGTIFETSSSGYASGRTVKITSFTSACVLPGDTGYVVDVKTDAYSKFASADIDSYSSNDYSITLPMANIELIGVSKRSDSLIITVKNSGSGSAVLGSNHTAILLDSANAPLHFTYVRNKPGEEIVAPNDTVQLISTNAKYQDWSSCRLISSFRDTTLVQQD